LEKKVKRYEKVLSFSSVEGMTDFPPFTTKEKKEKKKPFSVKIKKKEEKANMLLPD